MTSRLLALALLASLLAFPLHAQRKRSPLDPGSIDLVNVESTWKFLSGDAVHDKALTVFWMPASLKEAEHSPLMKSKSLAEATTRCVDLEIVLPDQAKAVAKLIPAGTAPAAIMIDRDAKVIRTVVSGKEIEKMVNAEIAARDDAMFRVMSDAGRQERDGNSAAAIELYKKIWNDRCLFPLAGSEAQRALKRLGVTVSEPTGSSQPLAPPPGTSTSPRGHAPGR